MSAPTDPDRPAPPMWRATAPPLIGAVERMAASLARAEAELGAAGFAAALETRPAPGMFPAGRQAATAAQFTLRTAFPLAGRRPPELRGALDGPGLAARIAEARALIAGLAPEDFADAETRTVRGQAGFAAVELPGLAFLLGFGLPNVHFHQAMLHVALKQAGAALGKADFDGLHDYPPGFAFG
jgi:hypothetical protein